MGFALATNAVTQFENGEDLCMEDLQFGRQIPRETDKNQLPIVPETAQQSTEMFEIDTVMWPPAVFR